MNIQYSKEFPQDIFSVIKQPFRNPVTTLSGSLSGPQPVVCFPLVWNIRMTVCTFLSHWEELWTPLWQSTRSHICRLFRIPNISFYTLPCVLYDCAWFV